MPDAPPLNLGTVPVPPEPEPVAAAPTPQVMARLMRLPTTSRARARAIIKLQLDRLSPLPVAETAFDLALVGREDTDGLFALGIVRKTDLIRPETRSRRTIALAQDVEGKRVVFQFRNPGWAGPGQPLWMRHAPRAAILAAAFAAVALAGAHRSSVWATGELPRLEAEGQARLAAARLASEQTAARAAWQKIDQIDAATRLTCVLERLDRPASGRLTLLGLTADPDRIVLMLEGRVDAAALSAAGAALQPPTSSDDATTAVFEGGECG